MRASAARRPHPVSLAHNTATPPDAPRPCRVDSAEPRLSSHTGPGWRREYAKWWDFTHRQGLDPRLSAGESRGRAAEMAAGRTPRRARAAPRSRCSLSIVLHGGGCGSAGDCCAWLQRLVGCEAARTKSPGSFVSSETGEPAFVI